MTTKESYAKINLGLSIPFKYENGYHHIVSPIAPISFSDTMMFEITSGGFQLDWKNEILGYHDPSVIEVFTFRKEDNLLFTIYQWLQKVTKQFYFLDKLLPVWGIKIFIIKRVPSPGGLGGGSSNAATFIRFMIDTFLKLDLTSAQKKSIKEFIVKECIQFGSDIPSLLDNRFVLVNGIGEVEEIFSDTQDSFFFMGILGLPNFGFSTKKMYQYINKPIVKEKLNKEKNKVILNRNTKNTLQGESKYIRFLKSQIVQYEFLFAKRRSEEYIIGCTLPRFENIDEVEKVIAKTKIGCYIKNEFFDIAKEVFHEEYELIISSLYEMRQEIEVVFEHRIKNLFYSISGSGSSFYILFFCDKRVDREKNRLLIKKAVDELNGKNQKKQNITFVPFEAL